MKWFYGIITIGSIVGNIFLGINNLWPAMPYSLLLFMFALSFTVRQIQDDRNKNKNEKNPPNDYQI